MHAWYIIILRVDIEKGQQLIETKRNIAYDLSKFKIKDIV